MQASPPKDISQYMFWIWIALEVGLSVLFVVLVWRYKRKSTVLHAALIFAALFAIIAAPFVAFSVPIAVDAVKEHRSRIAFDTTVWKASLSHRNDPIRLRMIDDLLRRYQLRGMREDELLALLGKPPKTDYFSEYQLVYWLGPERGFISLDSEWLAVRIGPDQRVTEARIVRD